MPEEVLSGMLIFCFFMDPFLRIFFLKINSESSLKVGPQSTKKPLNLLSLEYRK